MIFCSSSLAMATVHSIASAPSLVYPSRTSSSSSLSSPSSFSRSVAPIPPVKSRSRCLKIVSSSSSTSSPSSSPSQGDDAISREFALKAFRSRLAFKVISGLQNFDEKNVASVAIAAEQGGATHVDIACSAHLVKLVKDLVSLPICVSSIDPEAFLSAIAAGAHMVEMGNYDSFYQKSNRVFSAEEVLDLTRQTRQLLPSTVLSVTVPHTLSLVEQVKLAEMLEQEGADIIQTEGGTSSSPLNPGVHGLIEKAVPTLAAAYSISKAVKIPVMCASGLSDVTAPLALAAGAAGVGIGSAINKLENQVEMVAAVRGISDALGLPRRSLVHSAPNLVAY